MSLLDVIELSAVISVEEDLSLLTPYLISTSPRLLGKGIINLSDSRTPLGPHLLMSGTNISKATYLMRGFPSPLLNL